MKNKSAFPWTEDLDSSSRIAEHRGLTKREYFAGLAMQGMILAGDYTAEKCAELSVLHADALIAELVRKKS